MGQHVKGGTGASVWVVHGYHNCTFVYCSFNYYYSQQNCIVSIWCFLHYRVVRLWESSMRYMVECCFLMVLQLLCSLNAGQLTLATLWSLLPFALWEMGPGSSKFGLPSSRLHTLHDQEATWCYCPQPVWFKQTGAQKRPTQTSCVHTIMSLHMWVRYHMFLLGTLLQ